MAREFGQENGSDFSCIGVWEGKPAYHRFQPFLFHQGLFFYFLLSPLALGICKLRGFLPQPRNRHGSSFFGVRTKAGKGKHSTLNRHSSLAFIVFFSSHQDGHGRMMTGLRPSCWRYVGHKRMNVAYPLRFCSQTLDLLSFVVVSEMR
ncbi:hypothetical protein GQ607_009854 [Colletotrichum asianum]|uniref:Uncharacterized protein n=1 Tax=Colletotrichum asianum TaxID=702518 RepID=A0A8H3ZK70_9PEZI|nr:hypothetical protein GQ607_009854 [Colletotrichum asianum]